MSFRSSFIGKVIDDRVSNQMFDDELSFFLLFDVENSSCGSCHIILKKKKEKYIIRFVI